MNIERTQPDFDLESAVIVVGAGAAGLTAALAARDAGADVLLLERDHVAWGSTCMSQGFVCAAGTSLQTERGMEDGPDRFYDDIMARTGGKADPVLSRAVAENSGRAIDWLKDSHGIPFVMNISWAGFFGHSVNRMHGVPSKRGEELHGALMRAAEEAGVTVLTGAHVDLLYADETNRVTGVRVQRLDGATETVGCDALVLATCGFGANEEMVKEFIPSFGTASYYKYFGHEGNEGEGIVWGKELGGALGSMDAFQGYGALAGAYGVIVNYDLVMRGGITVNTEGKRFSNENLDISAQSLNVLRQPDGIGWIIFDDDRRALVEDLPEFQDLTGLGAFRTAETVEDLARIIKVPADTLQETLAETRRLAAGEGTCPFGRDFTLNPPLSDGPFHAIQTTGALFHTQGGLKVDARAQVLREDGSVLPNLFASGGTAESISGTHCDGYLPAAGLCMAVTLGMLAGDAAAQLVQD